MSTFLLMCFEFFKTGLFAVGGGLATIPFLREMAVKYGWFTVDKLTTMIAVSESTPGPVGINMATYVGYEMFGIAGGIAATLSLVAPSLIVICIIARMLEKFRNAKIVQGIFTGLRPAVVGFILSAVISIFLNALFNIEVWKASGVITDLFKWKALALFAVLLAFYLYKPKIHPIVLILAAGLAGVLFGF
ncbi:MAG: chromate transporter [Solobacterium sp.]|nr:chromate transporter [Solobacterium sp.]